MMCVKHFLIILLSFIFISYANSQYEPPISPNRGDKYGVRNTLLMLEWRGPTGTADIGLGMAIDILFLRVVHWLPRLSVFSIRDFIPRVSLAAPYRLEIATLDTERIAYTINHYLLSDTSNPDRIFELPSTYNVSLPELPASWEDAALVYAFITECLSYGIGVAQHYGSEVTTQIFESDSIIDFFQGVFFTLFIGVILAIFSLIWCLCLWVTLCYCCGVCICDLLCQRRAGLEEKAKKDNFQKWKLNFKRKKLFQKICRIFMLVFSIGSFISMFIWGFFAYQSHIGLSNTINKVNDDYSIVTDYADNVLDVPNRVSDIIDDIAVGVNDTVKKILELIPFDLDDITFCIMDIIEKALPDFSNMTDIDKLISSSIDQIKNIKEFEWISGNITYFLNIITKEILNNVTGTLLEIKNDMRNVQSDIGDTYSLISLFENVYPTNAELVEAYEGFEIMQNEKDNEMTPVFLNQMYDELLNMPNYNASQISDDLKTLQHSINAFGRIDINNLNGTLNKIINSENRMTNDYPLLEQSMNDLGSFENIIDYRMEQINYQLELLNITMDNFVLWMDNINNTMAIIQDRILQSLPDLSPLINQFLKLNDSSTYVCMNNITEAIWHFNKTIIMFPYNMSQMILELMDIRGLLNGEHSGGMLSDMLGGGIGGMFGGGGNASSSIFDMILGPINSIQDMITGQLFSVFDTIFNMTSSFGGANLLSSFPEFSSLTGDMTSMMSNMTGIFNMFNISIIFDQLALFNQSYWNDVGPLIERSKTFQPYLVDLQDLIETNETISNITYTLDVIGNYPCVLCDSMGFESHVIELNTTLQAVDFQQMMLEILLYNSSAAVGTPFGEFKMILLTFNMTMGNVNFIDSLILSLNSSSSLFDSNSMLNTFMNFNALTEQFLGGFENFTLGFNMSSILDQFDGIFDIFGLNGTALSMFGDILNIQNFINPILAQIPTYLSTVTTFMAPVNSTMEIIKGYISFATAQKDLYLNNYVYEFDGYRLLFFLFVIILFVPIPGLTIFACCCHKRPCLLIIMSIIIVSISTIFIIPSIIGIPLGIAMDDACDNYHNYLIDVIDVVGEDINLVNISNIIPAPYNQYINQSVISSLVLNGVDDKYIEHLVNDMLIGDLLGPLLESSLGALLGGLLGTGNVTSLFGDGSNNATMIGVDLDFSAISLQGILDNYLNPIEHCTQDDLLTTVADIFNSTMLSLVDNILILIMPIELPLGFRFAPLFPNTVRGITTPIVSNITDIAEYARDFIGCDELYSIWNIGYGSVCTVFRFSFMFFWGILLVAAVMLITISCFSFFSYCVLEHSYTRNDDDKGFGLEDFKADDLSSDDSNYGGGGHNVNPRNSDEEVNVTDDDEVDIDKPRRYKKLDVDLGGDSDDGFDDDFGKGGEKEMQDMKFGKDD